MAGYRLLCKKSFALDIILIILLVYLVYVFLSMDRMEGDEYISFSKSHKSKNKFWRKFEIKSNPSDYRSIKCITTKYEISRKISLISHFNNFQFYDLKVALSSALFKNEDFIGEIVIIDDGSNEQDVIDEAQKYLDDLSITVRLLRNELQLGLAKSLKKALEEVRYEEVIIFDPSVICSAGWLLPLLDEIAMNPKTIATPHFDKVSEVAAGRYERVDDNYAASLLWNLQTILVKSNDSVSPGMRPDLLAVRKSFLNQIGSIDEEFGNGGGELLELAMRVWCCGGNIKMISCSRVAIGNFHRPVKITSGVNLRRIVGLWFQNDSGVVMPLSRNFQPNNHELKSTVSRREFFKDLRCKNAQWYFKDISKKTFDLDSGVARFGNLRSKSELCAEVASDQKLNMISCSQIKKDTNIFQLTVNNKILVEGECLTSKRYSYVKLAECSLDDLNQNWELNGKLELYNIGTSSCATHVTDPDQSTPFRQVIMAQDCDQLNQENTHFKQWTFIPI